MMIEINCLGDICPVPLLKIKEALKTVDTGDTLLVITDHSCVYQNILDHFRKTKFEISSEEVINGVWEITMKIYR